MCASISAIFLSTCILFAVPTAPVTPPPTLSPPQAPTATTITVLLPPPNQIETGEI